MAEAIADCDSLEAVSKAALKASYAALQSRPAPGEKLDKALWVVATSDRQLFGPFGTFAEAEKAVKNGKIPNLEAGAERVREEGYVPAAQSQILPMTGPLAMAERGIEFDREARLFANHLCATCEHPSAKHNTQNRNAGCSIQGCGCAKDKPITL